ncbi:hypothetical protein ACMT1E_04310 [Sphingomonas flavalba]|uniref:hypothetical protein n=1 Tax=Sphingomonas flavalba TaxID=2559804 RepID=UPI0039DF9639
MSLPACIPGLIADGRISKAQAEKAERAYSRHYARLSREMGPEAAAAEASEAAIRELEYQAALAKRQTLLQVKAQQRITADMEAAGGGPGAATKVLAAGSGRNVLNVEAQHRAIAGRAHATMEGVLSRHSRNLIGEARDKAGLRDMVRERFGEKTGNASAAELAEAFGATADTLRRRFNAAGGNIGHLADWGLPQAHDMVRVRAAGFDAWRAEIAPRLDLSRMIDFETGAPFTADTLDAALRDVFDAIRSDGWIKRAVGGGGQGKLANRRADPRFLIFKSADDWMAYQERFGTGSAFDAMMGHIDGMARDIALMEVMGPNPRATLRWMQDGLQKAAATDGAPGIGAVDAARGATLKLDHLYDVVSGQMNSPVNQMAARQMSGVRSFLTSAFLGSAALTATTDVGFQAMTRGYNGLPITGAITGYLKLLNPLNGADRKTAIRLGLMAEEAAHRAASLNRYIDAGNGPEVAARLSDAVLRLSGLSIWTQAGRWAFGMEVLGHLADVRGRRFAELNPALRGMMERHGIDAAGWDAIRTTAPYRYKGGEWLRPDDVADVALGDAMLRMVLSETDYAVPTATARAKATLSFGQRPGTLGGEIIRNGALFKSFGVSMILTHGARMIEGMGWNAARYAAGLTITTTLLGALAVQLREIAQGRDPKPMDAPEFWGKAMLQGGGFGIFGDFLQASQNRFGGGIGSTLAGPVAQGLGDGLAVVPGYALRAAAGDDTINPGRDLAKLAKRYTPGGSLWYARLAYERLVLDQLQRLTDPDYDDAWRRVERRADDLGQAQWWRAGEAAPDRAPDLSNAVLGETPE